MKSTCDVDNSDLAQTTPSGVKIQLAMEDVCRSFSFETKAEGRNWSMVEGSTEGSNALSKVRKAFWAEFDESKEVATALFRRTCTNYWVYHSLSVSAELLSLSQTRHFL